MARTNADLMREQLQPYFGARLETAVVNGEDITLVLRTSDKRTVFLGVLCDPEGNGPGFLDVSQAFTDAELKEAASE